MTVELRPLGVTCNIRCSYCYQNPQRDAGNFGRRYDLEAMKATVAEIGGPFTLFGGEPLLVPLEDLEELWSWGFETYGASSLQTNGTLITDEHLRLFRRYAVKVGISVDGPEDLNVERRAGSDRQTAERTRATHRAIARLCEEGTPPGIIVTLHRTNAAADRLARMSEWFRHLDAIGVRRVRLHVLEWEESTPDPELMLTPEENAAALLHFARLEPQLAHLRFDLLTEMRAMLLARDGEASCVWHACDPYTTAAVQGVEGRGQSSNCGRTNKDGVDFVKAATVGHERQVSLYHTPQEHLGCQGCRFFLVCKGNCPGTASDTDWRNRSEHCALWMRLFEHLEAELVAEGRVPLSLHPLREAVERELVALWAEGGDEPLASVLQRLERDGAPGAPPAAAGAHPVAGRLLPAFCRVSWVGDRAREVWRPRLDAVRRAWRQVEARSVAEGLRAAAVLDVPPDELAELAERVGEWGLTAFALGVALPAADGGGGG
ncbi:MAG TPA: radical SAM protein, partial [Thermoanaerobaculia bacterium]|nr:radical SAM protein [Thermoanaerobaculia bacterium]